MNPHILFIDDEIPIRETLSLFFKMKKISVTAVESGEEAKRMAAKVPFTLVILDINLGGENGLVLLDFFKQNYPELPVILFTALGYDTALLNAALARGASAYMSKTESLDNLLKEVHRVMVKDLFVPESGRGRASDGRPHDRG